MTALAVWVLTVAVMSGAGLGLWHLRTDGGRPPALAGIAHAVFGVIGLGLLVVALRGPERGIDKGVSGFGVAAAWSFLAALTVGVLVWVRRRHKPGLSIAIHAGIAVTAWALLLAWDGAG